MDWKTDEDLAWAVEEACLNARPAPVQVSLGGWLLRAAGGPTRRTNSLNPLRGPRDDPAAVIAAAEPICRGLGRPLIVRVPDLAPEMDALLDRLGYRAEGETATLFADFAGFGARPPDDVGVAPDPDPSWFAAQAACEGVTDEIALRTYRASLGCLILPRLFVHRIAAGRTVGVAYGAVHRRLLVLESVATHPEHRRSGHAAALVAALMIWARGQGAEGACLQVVAGNHPARALYAGLGFTRTLHGYRYRRRD
ncbi:GNAT family N-acetyltransferase [Methylobacterium sp. J-068]|uniref:GNAT family N-acetyltransferase n=1 Tax=Methylobacterium sp. J-068 TaxID=2836649 RepID=UPI001FBAD184|nr:GNAT family N-acetyltransferase [Methylobacterium sp. J-068]MCJ2034550.1 GNAT family N-acetyltransferase [Methylobacterium sp. J-068]